MLEKPDYLKIGKSTGLCARCGVSLVEVERPASVLEPLAENESESPESGDGAPSEPAGTPEEDGEEIFQRMDYCPSCWKEMKENAYFSFWIRHQTATDLPPKKLNKTERNAALLALFDSLAEQHEEGEDFSPHLFFLAHLLMKLKVFKWLPSVPDSNTGEMKLRFQRARSDEEVLIADLDMPDEAILRIKQEVEEYLEQATGQAVRI